MVASGEGNEQPLGVARAAGEVSWAAAARMTAEAGGEKNRPLRTISAASTVTSYSSNAALDSASVRPGERSPPLGVGEQQHRADYQVRSVSINLLHAGCATPPRASTKRRQPAPMQDQRHPWRNLRYILPNTLLHRCKSRATCAIQAAAEKPECFTGGTDWQRFGQCFRGPDHDLSPRLALSVCSRGCADFSRAATGSPACFSRVGERSFSRDNAAIPAIVFSSLRAGCCSAWMIGLGVAWSSSARWLPSESSGDLIAGRSMSKTCRFGTRFSSEFR